MKRPLDAPFRDELLGVDRLEERALAIAARFAVDPRRGARSIFPRFEDNARALRATYRLLAGDVRNGQFITPAAEWLLDNFHLMAGDISDIRLHLPRGYYRELPRLASPDHDGHARIYAMAVELLRHSDSHLTREQLTAFVSSYQRVAPLTIGELWAWPSMLKLALIENLRRLADMIVHARSERLAADRHVEQFDRTPSSAPQLLAAPSTSAYVVQLLHRLREFGPRLAEVRRAVDAHLAQQSTTAEDAIRTEHQRQATLQASVANSVNSLRLCSSLNWQDYFESVSLVEQVLQRDPAGAYGRMDFWSRDRQRQAVEELAAPTGEAQVQVALRAVESARQAATDAIATHPASAVRAAHVGYHLLDRGRAALEADVAYRPKMRARLRRGLFRHATPLYLGALAALTAALLTAVALFAHRLHAGRGTIVALVVLLLMPMIDVAMALTQRVVARLVPPRRLPRLNLKNGVPEDARTMVVVPTMLTSVAGVAHLIEHMEVLALGNLDPHVHFAILSDFVDAPDEHRPDDEALLATARAGIEELNARFGPAHSDRFFLFHRRRQWNAREHVWMGWERKRGKLEEFNRLLRGSTTTSFDTQVGELRILPSITYCLTLDSDTRLPRDAARELIGIMAHPLNRPHLDASVGRVTEGYAILQPRVSVTMASAAGSLFSRTYAGHTGVDPYTTAVSDLYQDLFGEGSFTGKGLYHVDAFMAALEGRVPENALLSHDLFEGLYARTALVTDVEVVDDYPSSVLTHARRQHRWVRGDWQILWWLFPFVPTREGLAPNRLPLIARWKIFDNLRRSLLAPAMIAAVLFAWLRLPGSPTAWTAIAFAPILLPVALWALTALLGPRPRQTWRAYVATARDEGGTAIARALLQIVLLPSQAADMLHAIIVTVIRLVFTHRRLLEWETAAASERRIGPPRVEVFLREMPSGPLAAGLATMLIGTMNQRALPVAGSVAVLWLLSPLVAYWLSRPVVRRTATLSDADRQFLQATALKTWRYFETLAGADDHDLPPDNIQLVPERVVAHRTSPTNIGMSLLATVSAFDCGFIDIQELIERTDATLTTIERLERFHGHLLNWYETRTLQPLMPRYVSTVDSGNLAGALLTLASALTELGPADPQRLSSLAARASTLLNEMDFRFLFEEKRQLFAIGYRLADADHPGRADNSFYDLLASEARLASFVAIAKGDVPQSHWFHLGRSVTTVHGAPVLLSWSATMFEYLMPNLMMRSYPNTLLDTSSRMVVRRQIEYAASRDVPWGISESAYNVVDRHDTYQYKAFGVPGLGMKRGLGDDIVIAPYATALAASIAPAACAANLQRLAAAGLEGELGFYEAIDFTVRDTDGSDTEQVKADHSGVIVQTYFAHHAGMTLIAIANALHGDRMVQRFHADPRVQATELLLQERVPRHSPTIEPRPADDLQVVAAPIMPPVRRFRSPNTTVPHAQFLSNGNFVSVVTNAGGGSSSWRGLAITRSRRDAVTDPGSVFAYLRDVRSGDVWSTTYHPTTREPDDYMVTFSSEKATFRRRDLDITTQMEIAVSTEDDMEVRRLRISNHGTRPREIDVTSYAELALASTATDLAHPAFGKLFLRTEYLADSTALLCERRRRSPNEANLWAVHALSLEGRPQSSVEWETDRARFLGRGRDTRTAQSMDGRALSGTVGYVLDPIFSLRQRVRLAPGTSVRLSFATGVAPDRATAEALARKYHDPDSASRTFSLAFIHAQSGLRHLDISSEDAQLFERLASRVLYTDDSMRASPHVRKASTLNQSGLWRHSISGDLPILLALVVEDDDLSLVRQVLQAQEYWRLKGLMADVVIVNEHSTGYRNEIQEQLVELLDNGPWRAAQHRPGGAYLLRGEELSDVERVALEAASRVVLSGDRGALRAQLDRPFREDPPATIARVIATQPRAYPTDAGHEDVPTMTFDNGYGGFVDNGRSYTIVLRGNDETPLPWANVIATPQFGTVITASGSAHTWAGNSRENRLTPFDNDPVTDRAAEALFVRDDATGERWCPTPGPLARDTSSGPIVIRHSPGVTRFTRTTHGIRHELSVFVDSTAPIKYSVLTLTNMDTTDRALSVFTYNAWLLGPPREGQAAHVTTTRDAETGAIFASTAYSDDAAGRVAFSCTSEPVASATGDRGSFIGRNRAIDNPEALQHERLSDRFGAGLDPCAALQMPVALPAGATRTIVWALGQTGTIDDARQMIRDHVSVEGAQTALRAVEAQWDATLKTVQVKTPDDSFDVMMNGWLLYQSISCRLWARTGYFQPGGAFGFRDQLQDVLSMLVARPDLARAHILRAASRQFVEGDVQHWWHEPSGRGLRSRCSDDLLWLPYVVAEYVRTTGDRAFFDVRVPFLEQAPLAPGVHESYEHPHISQQTGTVLEHCVRAIEKSLIFGVHGLPLFGGGDWNDGMNLVGAEGRGESTWLGFFLFRVLHDIAPVCEAAGDSPRADRYRREARRLADALEHAWDGEWYRRGYYDDGSPLGSSQNDDCQIDSISQSWAVLTSAVPQRFAERAMDSVRARLVSRESNVVLLLSPPFDQSAQEPGYIKGYPPGVRENGGQYTHAAVWFVMAVAKLGRGDEAVELFHMLNPVNHARTMADAQRYKIEPYVIAGDVYARSPHDGRGGWSWYTGAAGWLYRSGLEDILGLRQRGDTFIVDPCIPSTWPECTVTWQYHETRYVITIRNPERRCRGVAAATLDGTTTNPAAIQLRNDGGVHQVVVTLGVK